MFSGGYDSTIAARDIAKDHDRVHLVTFHTWGITRVHHSEKNVKALKREFGEDRFIHEYLDIRDFHRQMISGFHDDYDRYCGNGPPGILCLSCKLAMHSRALCYCIEHEIPMVADGALRTQADHPELMPDVLNLLRAFYAEFGVRYVSPIYESGLTAPAKRRVLREHGYDIGLQVGRASKSIQPFCLVGPLATIWHFTEPYVESDMAAYVQSKMPAMREAVRAFCEPLGRHQVGPAVDLAPGDRVDHREFQAESEFGDGIDRFVSRAMSPLWWGFRKYVRFRNRKTR